jgi:hypothetical protein
MSEHAAVAAVACRNCGTGLVGAFCHGCGEPRPDHHEYQWKHVVHDATHEFLHFDGKIFRTLWLLISRAGFLTQEYWAGRRTAYIRPLRVYILIAAVHLLVVTTSLYRMDYFKSGQAGRPLAKLINRIAEARHVTPDQVDLEANRHMSKAYAAGQYLAVLGFACFPWMLYRNRVPYYVQHFIFSLHVYSFYFIATGITGLFVSGATWVRSPSYAITWIYLAFAVRRLYGESWGRAIWKGLLLRLGLLTTEALVVGFALFYAIFRLRMGH